jgi:hypothetical protein
VVLISNRTPKPPGVWARAPTRRLRIVGSVPNRVPNERSARTIRKKKIPLECGIADGETRTRTGDTTIFSRYVESVRRHAIPGNKGFRRNARSTAKSPICRLSPQFRGWLDCHPLFERAVAQAVCLVGFLEERESASGRAVPFREETPEVAASVRRMNSAAVACTHERRSAAVVGEVTGAVSELHG